MHSFKEFAFPDYKRMLNPCHFFLISQNDFGIFSLHLLNVCYSNPLDFQIGQCLLPRTNSHLVIMCALFNEKQFFVVFFPSCLFVLGLGGPIGLKLTTVLSLLFPSAGITGMTHHAQYPTLIFVLIIKYPNEKQLKGGMVGEGASSHFQVKVWQVLEAAIHITVKGNEKQMQEHWYSAHSLFSITARSPKPGSDAHTPSERVFSCQLRQSRNSPTDIPTGQSDLDNPLVKLFPW